MGSSGRVRSLSTKALVLKRKQYKEKDFLVTLLSEDKGKIVVIAKGARSLKSSKASILESGNVITAQLVTTQGLPILTQAKLISDCAPIRTNLPKIRQLFQFLEMIHALFAEAHEDMELFAEVMLLRSLLVTSNPTSKEFVSRLEQLIAALGYQHPSETNYTTLTEYVSALADRPLKAWEYLKI